MNMLLAFSPFIVFFIVAESAGAPRLISFFLTGFLIMGIAVGAIFAAAWMRERQGHGHDGDRSAGRGN